MTRRTFRLLRMVSPTRWVMDNEIMFTEKRAHSIAKRLGLREGQYIVKDTADEIKHKGPSLWQTTP